jgi:hypothetical protein
MTRKRNSEKEVPKLPFPFTDAFQKEPQEKKLQGLRSEFNQASG